jgi:hypothetical protein
MHMRRLGALALLGSVLTLSQPSLAQLAFGQEQEGDTQPQDDGAQPPDDQAPPPADAAPADVPWWQKQGGSDDLAVLFPLQNDYRTFWQFRAEALSTLDSLLLTDVMDGTALASDEAALRQLKAQGRAQVVVVENHPEIWYASPDEAVIYDPYVSRNYLVDARTRAPVGDGPNRAPSTASMAYHLTRHPDHFGHMVWKVDDSVRIAQ